MEDPWKAVILFGVFPSWDTFCYYVTDTSSSRASTRGGFLLAIIGIMIPSSRARLGIISQGY